MKLTKVLLAMAAMCLPMVACGDDDDENGGGSSSSNVTITATPETVEAPAVGGSYTISVTTTGKEWGAYTEDGWLNASASGTTTQQGTVTLTVSANTGATSRTGSVTIMSGAARKTISVTQSLPLQVSQTSVTTSSKGETVFVDVVCPNAWTATASDSWIKVEKTAVDPAANTLPGTGSLAITTEANADFNARTGQVTVTSGSEQISIEVKQNGAEDTNIATPEGYTLVWHDEFSTDGAPSTSSDGWNYETGHGSNGWGNNEIQNYVNGSTHPDVCFIKDGILNIVLQKVGNEVQSIRMNTNEAWTYGWFEARLKLPVGKGTWPAFWMMPKNFTSWPGDGEIDIMEEVGYNPNYVLSTIHCNKYNNGGTSIESAGRKVPTAQTEFHVYACEWTSDYMTFYIDGSPLLTYKNDGTGKNAWPFDAPFYLKLNLAWGGNWGGAQGIDESCLPATYQIDYVRVFQKK